LDECFLGDKGGFAIGQTLSKGKLRLKSLSLKNNDIGDKGAEKVA
jgi:hypothetical protein